LKIPEKFKIPENPQNSRKFSKFQKTSKLQKIFQIRKKGAENFAIFFVIFMRKRVDY